MLPAYLFTQPSLITGHPAVTTRGRTINLKRIQTKYQSESQGRGEGDDMTDYGREKKQHLVKIWEQLESVTGTGWSFPWLLTIPALLYDGGSFFNVRTEQWQSAQSVVLYFQCLVWSSDWEDRYIFSHFAGLLSHSHPALARNVQKFWSEKRRGAWDHPGNQGPRPESSNEGVAVWLFSLSSRQIIGLPLLCRETDQQRKISAIWPLFILIIEVKIDKVLTALIEQNLNGRHPLQHLLRTPGWESHHPLELLFVVDWSSQGRCLEDYSWWECSIVFLSLPLTSREEKYCLLPLKECFELDENSWIHWGSWYHLKKEKISLLQL